MKNIKSFLLILLSFCLCLTMPFVLTSCKDKTENTEQPGIEQGEQGGEQGGEHGGEQGREDDEDKEDKEDLVKYSIVLKNFICSPNYTDGEEKVYLNESYALDFAELHLGFDGENVVGYGTGKIYSKEAGIVEGDLKAYVKNSIVYFTAENSPSGNEKILGKVHLNDLIESVVSNLPFPVGNLNETVNQGKEQVESLVEEVKSLVGENSLDLSGLKQQAINTFFTTSEDGDNIVYTLNFEAFKTINEFLATAPISTLYDLANGLGSYQSLVDELNEDIGLTVGELYAKLEEKGIVIDDVFAELDRISAKIGDIILSAMPTEPLLPEMQAENLVVADEYLLTEVPDEELPIEEFKISTLEDLLAFFEIDLPENVVDISDFVTSDEFKAYKVVDLLNGILLESKYIENPIALEDYQGFISNFGNKTVYEVVEDLMPYVQSYIASFFNNKNSNEAILVEYGATEETSDDESFATFVKKFVDSKIDEISKMFALSYKLNPSNELLEVNISVKAQDVAFELAVIKDYVTNVDYSSVKTEIEDLLKTFVITKEALPETTEYYTLEILEADSTVTYEYVENETSTPDKYQFVFDNAGKLLYINQHIESSFESIDNTIYTSLDKCSIIVRDSNCGHKYFDLLIFASNIGNVAEEDLHAETMNFGSIQLSFNTETNKIVLDYEQVEHKYVEVVADRKTLSYGILVHYICDECHEEKYKVMEFVPDWDGQYALNNEFYYDSPNAYFISYSYEAELDGETTTVNVQINRNEAYLYHNNFMYYYNSENEQWEMLVEFDLTKFEERHVFENYYGTFTLYTILNVL